jgi:hypothetical protein
MTPSRPGERLGEDSRPAPFRIKTDKDGRVRRGAQAGISALRM